MHAAAPRAQFGVASDLHRGVRQETWGAGGVPVALSYLVADLLQQVGAVEGEVTAGSVEREARGLQERLIQEWCG